MAVLAGGREKISRRDAAGWVSIQIAIDYGLVQGRSGTSSARHQASARLTRCVGIEHTF